MAALKYKSRITTSRTRQETDRFVISITRDQWSLETEYISFDLASTTYLARFASIADRDAFDSAFVQWATGKPSERLHPRHPFWAALRTRLLPS